MVEENLIREFIAEAEEHIFTLEPDLLRLEKEPHNQDLVNEIFLATHSIKGTASYVGLSHISSFTHALESLLDRLRKGTIHTSPELVDLLLQGLDMLRLLIHHVATGQVAPDTSVMIQKLLQWQEERVDMQGIELDSEDAEIFADIAGQQIEFMRLALEKIRETVQVNDEVNQQKTMETLAAILKAFGKIKSSAALLEIEALDAILDTQEQVFSSFVEPSHHLSEQDVEDIVGIIQHLEEGTQIISAYCAQKSPSSLLVVPQETDITEAPLASEMVQGRILRVNAGRVDHLLNLVGELVINRAKLEQIGQEIKILYEDLRAGAVPLNNGSSIQTKKSLRTFKKLKEHFDEITLDLGRLTNQMQEGTMRIRMVPISQVLNRFPRMVRDLSRQAAKAVEIRIYGAETELDKTVVDQLGDPLIHIIRNAIDHGIELPEERELHGKPLQGTIRISAYHEGNQVIIEIADDGKGIDARLVKQKALQQHLISSQEAETLQYQELSHLIFQSGFSTVDSVSSLSGRGVGLNVVKRYLEKINGSIELESTPGKGCTFTIKLPLTLAIIPALMVKVKTEIFAIPLISVEEAIRIVPQDIKTIESHQVIHLRERIVPLFDLVELFGPIIFDSGRVLEMFQSERSESRSSEEHESQEEKLYGVVLSDGFRDIGILVDAFLGEHDIVIKSLNDELVNVEGIAGASIRGDGEISLVIDPASLIHLAIKYLRHNHRARTASNDSIHTGHDDQREIFSTEYSPISVSEE